MEYFKVVFVLLAVLLERSCGDCGVDGLQCCLTEFLNFVSPSGIQLTEKRVNTSCMTYKNTFRCLEDYSDQCVSSSNEKLEEGINSTKMYLRAICLPESNFRANVSTHEECLVNATASFLDCYSKSPIIVASKDDKSKWKAACCDYKNVRDCAIETVENSCGAGASQMVQEEIITINGLGLQLACESVFEQCISKATGALPSFFMVMMLLSLVPLSKRVFL